MWSSASFISIENLTNSTWKFVIKPNDNFKYTPGQFVQIKIKNVIRSYSIASYNSSENIFELLIVKLEGGVMSKILFEEINDGDKLEIKGPLGRFTLPEKIDGDIFYSQKNINKIKVAIESHFTKTDSLTISEFKEISNTTRKLAVPLLEYLDKINFTYRVGDSRELNRS